MCCVEERRMMVIELKSNSQSTLPAASLAAPSSPILGPSTTAVHAGSEYPKAHNALTDPVIQTATYTFENTADLRSFQEARMWGGAKGRAEYGRYRNPTVAACEARLAALDHGDDAILFASGMAAVTSVLLAMLPGGAHIVIGDGCYRRTRQFCLTFLNRLGITTTGVPMCHFGSL